MLPKRAEKRNWAHLSRDLTPAGARDGVTAASKWVNDGTVTTVALPEIVWVLGRKWVVPKGVPSFVRRGEGR